MTVVPVSRDELDAMRDLAQHWERLALKAAKENCAMRRVIGQLTVAADANDPIEIAKIIDSAGLVLID